jgi:hypothetical protein
MRFSDAAVRVQAYSMFPDSADGFLGFDRRVKGILTFSGHESPVRSYSSRELLDEQQKIINWFYEVTKIALSLIVVTNCF